MSTILCKLSTLAIIFARENLTCQLATCAQVAIPDQKWKADMQHSICPQRLQTDTKDWFVSCHLAGQLAPFIIPNYITGSFSHSSVTNFGNVIILVNPSMDHIGYLFVMVHFRANDAAATRLDRFYYTSYLFSSLTILTLAELHMPTNWGSVYHWKKGEHPALAAIRHCSLCITDLFNSGINFYV